MQLTDKFRETKRKHLTREFLNSTDKQRQIKEMRWGAMKKIQERLEGWASLYRILPHHEYEQVRPSPLGDSLEHRRKISIYV